MRVRLLSSDYWKGEYKDLATLEFSRDRKSMSVLSRNSKTKRNELFAKGAPETLLTRWAAASGAQQMVPRVPVAV